MSTRDKNLVNSNSTKHSPKKDNEYETVQTIMIDSIPNTSKVIRDTFAVSSSSSNTTVSVRTIPTDTHQIENDEITS